MQTSFLSHLTWKAVSLSKPQADTCALPRAREPATRPGRQGLAPGGRPQGWRGVHPGYVRLLYHIPFLPEASWKRPATPVTLFRLLHSHQVLPRVLSRVLSVSLLLCSRLLSQQLVTTCLSPALSGHGRGTRGTLVCASRESLPRASQQVAFSCPLPS